MAGFNCYEVKKSQMNDTKITKKWSFSKNSYGLWYVRDSRNISGMVGIFFFLLMMIVFFSTIERKKDDEKIDDKVKMSPTFTRSSNFSYEMDSFCVKNNVNSIMCTGVNSKVMTKIQEEINDMFAEVADSNDLTLSFIGILDPENVIIRGWLKYINVSLNSLIIRDTAMAEIKGFSFISNPFINLQQLTLVSSTDLRLNSESFSGLLSLTSLTIGDQNGPKCLNLFAEENTLQGMPLLSILQITGCTMSPQVLKNLTGGKSSFELDSLKLLDIQKNSLGKLLGDSFSKVTSLESLYLDNSNLSGGVEPTAFRGTNNLKLITMKSTHLTKLPEETFDGLMKHLMHLDLTENDWNCTCDFKWFQEMYNSKSWLFNNTNLFCFHDGRYEDLTDFPFCASTTTPFTIPTTPISTERSTEQYPSTIPESTTSQEDISTGQPFTTIQPIVSTTDDMSTTRPTTDSSHEPAPFTTSYVSTTHLPTTGNPDDYDPINCLPANRSLNPSFGDGGKENQRIIYLERENLRFSFIQVGNEPKFEVTIDKPLGNDFVLIFMNRAGWILCLSNLQDNFNVENLDYGQSYIMCMLKSSQSMVSPRNCQSLNVPKEWGKQSWITNDNKVPIVIGVSSSLFFILLVSLCGMYTYIKRNPYIVYGKENVIVVERENSKKVTVQDQNYEQPRYPPSLISWSDGYITPKLYESVEEFSMPCIDQYPNDFRRSKILPVIRSGHLGLEEFDSVYRHSGEIYETVNTCPSPYYSNDDFSHNIYSSL